MGLYQTMYRIACDFGTEATMNDLWLELNPLHQVIHDKHLLLLPPSRAQRQRAKQAIVSASGQAVEHLVQVHFRPRGKNYSRIYVPELDCVFDVIMRLGSPPSAESQLDHYRSRTKILDPNNRSTVSFRHHRPDQLLYQLDEELWRPLQPIIWRALGQAAWKKLGTQVWDGCLKLQREILFVHIGYTLVGAKTPAAATADWVTLLPHAIPLGHKRGAPDCWYVAVG